MSEYPQTKGEKFHLYVVNFFWTTLALWGALEMTGWNIILAIIISPLIWFMLFPIVGAWHMIFLMCFGPSWASMGIIGVTGACLLSYLAWGEAGLVISIALSVLGVFYGGVLFGAWTKWRK